MSKKLNRCLNSACYCVCDADSEYCSNECSEADEEQFLCACNHEDCCPKSGPTEDELPSPH